MARHTGDDPAELAELLRQARPLTGPLSPKGSPCWVWQRALNKAGRPVVGRGGRMFYVYRLVYAMCKGEIPTGMDIHHLCFNPSCIRPSHLILADPSDNRTWSNNQRYDNDGPTGPEVPGEACPY